MENSAETHVTVIDPERAPRFLDFSEYWLYRELQFFLIWRDVKVKYKAAMLGIGWAVLQPLLIMVMLSVIFGRLAGLNALMAGVPYPLFVLGGLLLWNYFSSTVAVAGFTMVGNQQMINKIYFPRIMLPWGAVGAGLVDLACGFLVFLGLAWWYGLPLGWHFLLLPVVVLMLVFTTAGVGTLFASLCAMYRDFRHLLPFLMQAWMYATPVIYPLGLIPEAWSWVFALNPLTGIVELFRCAVFGSRCESFFLFVGLSASSSMLIFAASVMVFRHHERRFADVM